MISHQELVDALIKEGMTEAHRMLMHIREKFKNDPKTYNHFEMNLKIMYRDKVRRERKLKIKKPGEDEEGEDDAPKEAPDLFRKMTTVKSKQSLSNQGTV
jgi:hypothetical protein